MANEIKGQGIVREVRHLLTYDCVLRCRHCYLSAGEHSEIRPTRFSQEQADSFYGFFKPESVSATGGEPLLEPDLVRILARSTAKYGGALELVTNGLLLKEDFVRELTDLNNESFYQISFDGSEEFHDTLRCKKGAYKKAIGAIDLTSRLGRIVKARMTVTSDNYSQVPEVIKTLDNFERKNIKLVLRAALNTGRARRNKLSLDGDKVKVLNEFKSIAKNIGVSVTERCGYCLDSIAIDPRGDVFPCCYFVFNPEYKMGNMQDPKALQAQPDFVNFKGKCFAIDKFAQIPDEKSRCTECKERKFLRGA
jgi:radical SAM protein with 4Fe4S-binding SPASM domain